MKAPKLSVDNLGAFLGNRIKSCWIDECILEEKGGNKYEYNR